MSKKTRPGKRLLTKSSVAYFPRRLSRRQLHPLVGLNTSNT